MATLRARTACSALLTALLTACSGGPDATTTAPGEVAVPTPGEVLDPAGASVDAAGFRVAVPCHTEWVCLWRNDDLEGVLPGSTATAWVPRGADHLLVTPTSPSDDEQGLLLQDPDTGREVERLRTEAPVESLATSADGSTLVVVTADATLVLEARTLAQRHAVVSPGEVLDVAVSPDGAQLLVAAEGSAPTLVDVRTGRTVLVLGEEPATEDEQVSRVAWSPAGTRVVTVSAEQVQVREAGDGTLSAERPVPARPTALTYGPDEVRLALAAEPGEAVLVWSWAGDGELVLDEHATYPAERLLWNDGAPGWLYAVGSTELRLFDLDVPTEQAVDDPPFPEELPDLDLRR
ncbi:hypothetical protein [Nocardioides nanhaiensis]|uniref:WD40 repeat domain-containing protein n=1 Tax=Nocardioides nanhaiensis TaxID=1476871 RepID=A0ABP8VNF6_9ACTN